MAKKRFKDINGVIFTDKTSGRTFTHLDDSALTPLRLVQFDFTNGDEIFVINEDTLRLERFIVKRKLYNSLICVRATKDRQLLPSTRYYVGRFGLIGDLNGLNESDIIRVFVNLTSSHTGNIFTTLDEANKAIDMLMSGKTFKTAPINSQIYMVDREQEKITEHTITGRTFEAGKMSLFLNDNIEIKMGSTAFEDHGSEYTDIRTFTIRSNEPNTRRWLYSRTVFIDKRMAENYLRLLINARKRKIKPTPMQILKRTKGEALTILDTFNKALKVGDKVIVTSNSNLLQGVAFGETDKMIKILLTDKEKCHVLTARRQQVAKI